MHNQPASKQKGKETALGRKNSTSGRREDAVNHLWRVIRGGGFVFSMKVGSIKIVPNLKDSLITMYVIYLNNFCELMAI
jgi:hypothetical protein